MDIIDVLVTRCIIFLDLEVFDSSMFIILFKLIDFKAYHSLCVCVCTRVCVWECLLCLFSKGHHSPASGFASIYCHNASVAINALKGHYNFCFSAHHLLHALLKTNGDNKVQFIPYCHPFVLTRTTRSCWRRHEPYQPRHEGGREKFKRFREMLWPFHMSL